LFSPGIQNEALGGFPIVYDDVSQSEAVQQVVNVTQLQPLEFEAAAYEALVRGAKPHISGEPATLVRCAGSPTTLTTIRDAVKRARSSIDYMQDDKALAHLKAGITAIRCLNEPLDNEVVADLYFLAGFLHHAAGAETAASSAFTQSIAFNPELGWDTYFSPEGKPLFDEAKQQVEVGEMVSLTVSPTPPEGTLWINGKPSPSAAVELPIGESFIQLTGESPETFTIELETGGNRHLLLANQLPLDALGWITDQERSTQLEALFLSAFEVDQTMYAVTNGAVWSHTVGKPGWTLLVEAGGASQRAIDESTRYARQPHRTGMITAGIGGASAGFALGSLAAALHAISRFQSANDDLAELPQQGDNFDEATDLANTASNAKAKVPGRMIAAGVFTVVGGAGVAISTSQFAKAKKRRSTLPSWHPYAPSQKDKKQGDAAPAQEMPAEKAAAPATDVSPTDPPSEPAEAAPAEPPAESDKPAAPEEGDDSSESVEPIEAPTEDQDTSEPEK